MNTIWAISLITYKEGLRHRVLTGITISALLVIFFSIFLSGLFMRDVLKTLLDICLSAISLGGLLVPFFLTINLFSGDLERRTIYTILAKPVPRYSYILGKFFGLSLLCLSIMAILTIAALLAVIVSRSIYRVEYFQTFSVFPILLSSITAYLGVIVMNSCVVLWCCITTSSFLATLLSISTYIIGQSVEDIVRFISLQSSGVEITPAIAFTTKITLYVFPNLAAFDYKHIATHGSRFPFDQLTYLVPYAFSYISCILLLASFLFNRRDLT